MLKHPCKFYNTTGKCRFGRHCKFSHSLETLDGLQAQITENEAVNSETVASSSEVQHNFQSNPINNNEGLKSVSSGEVESITSGISHLQSFASTSKDEAVESREVEVTANHPKICNFFLRQRYCRYGSKCKFQHVLPSLSAIRGEKNHEISRDAREAEKETSKNVVNSSTTGSNQYETAEEERPNMSEWPGLQVETNETKANQAEMETRRPKLCRFYRQGYCRLGKKCNFYHPPRPQKQQERKEKGTDEPKAKSNVEPEDTGFTEVVARKPKVSQFLEITELDKEKQKELRQTEITQLKRRFPKDHITVLKDTDEETVIRFTFIPSDPDWPFDVRNFDIQVSIGQDYPLKQLQVEVPLDQDLPATVQRYIEVSLQEWLSQRARNGEENGTVELVFRPFLRWMDRSIETVVTEGLKQLRRELTAKAAGLQFITASELKQSLPASDLGSDSDDISPDGDDVKDNRRPVAYRKGDYHDETYEPPANQSSSEEEDEGSENDNSDGSDQNQGETNDDNVHQRPTVDANTERRGTEMSFKNMQIWYCTTVMVEKLKLVVHCERCKNATDFSTPPNRVNSVPCSKCNSTMLVVFRPVLAHSYSSTFGYLDLDGCTVFDVIIQDCHLSMGCIMCSRDILVKNLSPGRVLDIFCRGCHHKMQFAAEAVKFQHLTTSDVDTSKFSGSVYKVSVRKMTRVIKDPSIQEGKSLPDNGACKHYKKSFRWLRFPCCGKTYPCDLCHDDKEDHEMKFANRMICGFCCREQPYSAERPCAGCSSALTKVRTAHWEGGRGCRNKLSMSKTDDKKYTNMNKTVSNKAKATQVKKTGAKNTKLRHT